MTEYDRETLKEFSDVKAEVEKLLDVFKFRDAQKEAMNQIVNLRLLCVLIPLIGLNLTIVLYQI